MHWREMNAGARLDLAMEILSSLRVENTTKAEFLFSGRVRMSSQELDDVILAETAREELRWREARGRFFSADLWGELGWSILLDLFVQRVRGKAVSITSACIASGGPPTTALRWLHQLEQEGLIYSQACSADARRRYVGLSPSGYESMRRYLSSRSGQKVGPAQTRSLAGVLDCSKREGVVL